MADEILILYPSPDRENRKYPDDYVWLCWGCNVRIEGFIWRPAGTNAPAWCSNCVNLNLDGKDQRGNA